MLPVFPKVCFVMIRPADNYNVGDVISLKTLDGVYHNHRITEIDGELVSTKGDNLKQQWYEQNVPISNIHGRVTLLFPK
jgi:hypothetical protein